MNIDRSIFCKIIILIITFIISFGMVVFSNSIILHVSAMVMVSVLSFHLVKYDLMHPYTWFTGFYCLYSTGFPLTYYWGYDSRAIYTSELMLYQLMALFIILLIITPKRIATNIENLQNIDLFNFGIFNKSIYCVLMILILFGGIYVLFTGFTGKGEIYATGNLLLNSIFKIPLIISMLYPMYIIGHYHQYLRINKSFIVYTFASLLVITIFSGERDFVFRFLLLNVFLFWYLKKISTRDLLLITPLFVLLIPLSATFKYFFLRNEFIEIGDSIIFSFFHGEFDSASCNFQVLLNNSSLTNGVKGWIQILLDVLAAFSSDIQSTGMWFNDYFYPFNTSQYGFTLIGEGYLIDGLNGIIVLSLIIGYIVRVAYRYSQKSIYYLSAYFYFITLMIYSIRGDFSMITAGISKQIILVLVITKICEKLSKKEKYTDGPHG